MIDPSRLTGNEIAVLRDALVTYCASLDKRIARVNAGRGADDLTWRRFLCDEILDALPRR